MQGEDAAAPTALPTHLSPTFHVIAGPHQPQQGGRDSGSIVNFAVERWSSAKPPPEVRMQHLLCQSPWLACEPFL
jgi:hypothetical protein